MMEYVDLVKEWVVFFFAWLWGFWQVKMILAHIAINLVVAIAAAIHTGEFELSRVGEFLWRKALPFTMVFAAFALMAEAADLGALTSVAFAALEAVLLGDLLDSLGKLGIAVPESLRKRPA